MRLSITYSAVTGITLILGQHLSAKDLEGEFTLGINDDPVPLVELTLEYETKRKNHWKFAAEVKANYYEQELLLEEAYVDYKPEQSWRHRIGIQKIPFGVEYTWNKERRVGVRRSLIYQRLEDLGLLGRDLLVKSSPMDWPAELNLAAGTNGSKDQIAIVALTSDPDASGYGLWTLAKQERIANGRQVVGGAAAAAWWQAPTARGFVELHYGVHPKQSEAASILDGKKTSILYRGLTTGGFYHWTREEEVNWGSGGQVTWYQPNAHLKDDQVEATLAIERRKESLTLKVAATSLWQRVKVGDILSKNEQSTVALEGTYSF